jgi:hypothetical protein
MNKSEKRKYCSGCYNDYYNYNTDGGCWSLGSAKVCWKIKIGVDEMPPYKKKKQRVLSCWRGRRIIAIDPDKSLTSEGYWKS